MNITIDKKENNLQAKTKTKKNKTMPRSITLYFESFTTDQMRQFILSSSEEMRLKLLIALVNIQTQRLSTITTSRENEGKRKFVKEVEDNALNGETGKAKTKLLREKIDSFNQHEAKAWTDSLLTNVSVKLKRNLIWIEENADKIALKKEKKAAREKARRLKNKQK